jgi:plastocyanin
MSGVSATMKAAVLAAVVVLAGPAAVDAAQGGASETIGLTMSNFRYCAATTCTPADQGYVRTEQGPVPGADNPHGIVDVPEGATVRWVYRDVGPGSCDSFEQCPGHNVRFEDGTAEGTSMGAARSRSGETTITATIGQNSGGLIRYFCSINDHYQLGMTGILRVVITVHAR